MFIQGTSRAPAHDVINGFFDFAVTGIIPNRVLITVKHYTNVTLKSHFTVITSEISCDVIMLTALVPLA